MSSPPDTPKQKKGIRQLLKESFRSRSRSPSQSLLQPDHGAPPATTGFDEGIAQTANPGRGTPLVDNVTTIAHQTGLSSIASFERAGGASRIPIIIEPVDVGPTTVQLATGQEVSWPALFGQLEPLLSCLDGVEVVVQNRQDFEDLATELAGLSESLNQHMNGFSSMLMSGSTASVAMAIEQQTMVIKEKLVRAPGGGIRGTSMNEEELVKHYRKIQSHFRQLQTNASMSTWSIANEHLVNTRLESLSPVKQATYDSRLSTQINRRDDWLYDSTSSSIYWMNGMAGTGKSTIASTFSDRVERRKLLAASFFCTRSSAECRDATRIVPTIAYQLARYSIPFQSELCKILGQNPDIGSKNMLKQFEQLLKEPLQQVQAAMPEDLVVVIDALDDSSATQVPGHESTGAGDIQQDVDSCTVLDECDDRNGVELMLDILFRHAAHLPLKFLVTSRPEPEIYSKMSTHAQSREVIHLHDIEKSLVRADIELYLKEELGFMSPPASPAEIEQLVQRSGTLFIYAATLVRYIRSGKRLADPHKRLRSVLGLTPESTKKHTQIDALYTAVLRSALNEDELEADETEDIRVVLRTVLFAQEPISVETIAELAEIDDPQRVINALHPLRSVLHQSDETGLVSTLHASFPDFMFSHERSGTYFFDVVQHSQMLARRCLSIMKDQLRFNICDLASSFLPDGEVENIQERIKANISPTLAYACRYWTSHLTLAPQSDALLTVLDEFLRHRLLFWMEVLSLRRELPLGVDGLLKVHQWLIHKEISSIELVHWVDEARSFVTSFAVNPTSKSTPHIYLSTLSLCPRSSNVYKHYGKRSRGLLELKGSLMEVREGAPLADWNFGWKINSLALSPDGTRVIIGSYDTTVRILSAYNRAALVGPLEGHTGSVTSVAFSSDGGRVVSVSRDGIRVWNAHNGSLISGPFGNPRSIIRSVSFSPDGARVVSDASVHKHYEKRSRGLLELKGDLMALREGAPLAVWQVGFEIESFALSPDGTRVVIGCRDTTIQILSAYDGAALVGPLQGHTEDVSSVAFSRDGGRVVSVSKDGIRVWHAYNGTLLVGPFRTWGPLLSVSFSPDGTRVVSGGPDGTVRIWDAHGGTLIFNSLPIRLDLVYHVIFSPNGAHIAASSAEYAAQLWNSVDGTLTGPPFKGHTGQVKCLAFTPNSTRLVSGSDDTTIRVWNIPDGSLAALPFEGHTSSIQSVAVSPNGTRVVSSGSSTVRLWRIDDGTLVAGPFYGPTASLNSLAYSPDGTRIIYSGLSYICVRSMRDGIFPPPPPPPQDIMGIRYVIFRPDSTHFLTTGRDTLRIWDATDGSFTTSPNQAEFMPNLFSTISPDGSCIASTHGDNSLQVVNMMDGSLAAGPFEVERSSLSTLWFSRNNRAIIMGCLDGTIKVCDLQSGDTAVGSFVAHHKRVSSISESPDCSLLVSHSDYEMAIRVWNIVTPALELEVFNTSIDPTSGHSYAAVYDGRNIREDGWVVNNSQHLLFWLPPDLASAWCSPYATLVVTQSGILRVPKQKLFVGEEWTRCYVPD
ncbi:hypothetical protein RSAG8_07039, partial [Rhizoctonia solani AG-8 WAC10335]